MALGAFPGSFDPPTVAHLAIAEAAVARHGLDRLDLVVSRIALVKGRVARPRLEHRLEVLERVVAGHDRLGLVLTERQLIADIAEGYDVVVLGADKWAQVQDPAFYGDDPGARDAALRRLPTVAVVPRDPHPTPPAARLDVPGHDHATSSTRARAGDRSLMAPAARAFDEATGAWTDAARYDAWLATGG